MRARRSGTCMHMIGQQLVKGSKVVQVACIQQLGDLPTHVLLTKDSLQNNYALAIPTHTHTHAYLHLQTQTQTPTHTNTYI